MLTADQVAAALAHQGVPTVPERAHSMSTLLSSQAERERAATSRLDFETEPSHFLRALESKV